MKTVWCLLFFGAIVVLAKHGDPAANQIVSFRNKTSGPVGIMTCSLGAPINYDDANSSLNKRLIFHEFFMDYLTHFSRERLPPRVVHAKGSGAYGYFEVTHDLHDICKAKVFSKVGKKTPVAVRFSPVMPEVGGPDTTRDARGFAIKFYTEDGNFDIVGLNTPMFIIKDPLLFPSFVHSQKKNPQTYLPDSNMFWDFAVRRPESMFLMLRRFSDSGIPDGYRYMPGFSIHTYQVVNDEGESFFIRFHFTPDAGVKNLGTIEATKLAGINPDYAQKDLYNAIANGYFPSWTVSIQVLSMNDVKNAGFDVFDVTRILPEDRYPLQPVGRFVLKKNPVNYFAEMEQLAFCPSNLVPGILGAPDKLFEARRLSYRDAQYYRLGANFHNIEVNKPIHETFTYIRDGRPPVGHNEGGIPNYYPNSYHGPVPYLEKNRVELVEIFEDATDNFGQARKAYNDLSSDEKTRMIGNLMLSLGSVTDSSLKDRTVKLLKTIHPELGRRVWEGLLGINKTRNYWDDWIF